MESVAESRAGEENERGAGDGGARRLRGGREIRNFATGGTRNATDQARALRSSPSFHPLQGAFNELITGDSEPSLFSRYFVHLSGMARGSQVAGRNTANTHRL